MNRKEKKRKREEKEKKRKENEVSLTEHGGQVGPLTRKERLRDVLCICAPISGVKVLRCK